MPDSDQQERTRVSLMEDFEVAMSNLPKDKFVSAASGKVEYSDYTTRQAFLAWVSSYETYAGYVLG